jgi:Zn finger protein HypA/HybF involved in hydrogenase expression
MHGFSIANEIIKKVLHEAEKAGDRRIIEIRVKCGRRVFSDPSELTEAYRLLVKDLDIRDVPLTVEFTDGSDCILDEIVFE